MQQRFGLGMLSYSNAGVSCFAKQRFPSNELLRFEEGGECELFVAKANGKFMFQDFFFWDHFSSCLLLIWSIHFGST